MIVSNHRDDCPEENENAMISNRSCWKSSAKKQICAIPHKSFVRMLFAAAIVNSLSHQREWSCRTIRSVQQGFLARMLLYKDLGSEELGQETTVSILAEKVSDHDASELKSVWLYIQRRCVVRGVCHALNPSRQGVRSRWWGAAWKAKNQFDHKFILAAKTWGFGIQRLIHNDYLSQYRRCRCCCGDNNQLAHIRCLLVAYGRRDVSATNDLHSPPHIQ